MKSIKIIPLFFLALFAISCGFLTKALPSGSGSVAGTDTGIGSGDGPSGFTGKSNPFGNVMLKWQQVDGAMSYQLERQLLANDLFLPLAQLGPGQTDYKDFTAPDNRIVTYRVQATTDKLGGYSSVTVPTVIIIPNPLTVQVQYMDDQMVTKNIGPEGGSIGLTDTYDIAYELVVPPGAVLQPTDFTLTPVANEIGNMPLDGPNIGSVKIGPENVDIYTSLILKIIVPNSLMSQAGKQPVGYGFTDAGDEFHLIPFDQTVGLDANGGGVLAMLVPPHHSGSYGVGLASKKSIQDFVNNHPVTDVILNSLQREVAQQVENQDLPEQPKEDTQKYRLLNDIDTYASQVETANTCLSVTTLMEQTRQWYSEVQGIPGLDHNLYDAALSKVMDDLEVKIQSVVSDGTLACEQYNNSPQTLQPPSDVSCLKHLLNDLERSTPSGQAPDIFNGRGLDSQTLNAAKTTLEKCGSQVAYRFTGGSNPDPVCDFTKPFEIMNEGVVKGNFQDGSYKGSLVTPIEGIDFSLDATFTVIFSEDHTTATVSVAAGTGTVKVTDPGLGDQSIEVPTPPMDLVFIADPSATCP
jgi:hypothetical protein